LIPLNPLDGRLYDHTSALATLEAIFDVAALTKRDSAAKSLTTLLTLEQPRADAPPRLPEPAPPAELSGCGPLSGCASLPSAEQSRIALATPADDTPLVGNQPGFVLVALMRDLAVAPASEHDQRIARAQAVRTREQGRSYLLEVLDRVQAAPAPPPAA
jgi:hypothetical protein